MGDITIRLTDAAAARLAARAKAAGRSVEDEARILLEEAAGPTAADTLEQRAFIKRLKRMRQDFFNDHLAPDATARFLEAHRAPATPARRRRVMSGA
jgi:hypothetical protein